MDELLKLATPIDVAKERIFLLCKLKFPQYDLWQLLDGTLDDGRAYIKFNVWDGNKFKTHTTWVRDHINENWAVQEKKWFSF